MDLSNLHIPEQAKKLAPIITCTVEGILEDEDIRQLLTGVPEDEREMAAPPSLHVTPEDPGDLKKIREKHHSLARLIASGMTQRMAATLSGFSETYVSILLNNPSMAELVEMYRIQHGAGVAVISEKLKTVGLKAVEKLEEKMESSDGLNAQELLGLAKLGLDRGGHGPSSSQHIVSENHEIDHAKIAALNAEARKGSSQFIVPVSSMKQLPPPKDD